jgi:hypothetical protein
MAGTTAAAVEEEAREGVAAEAVDAAAAAAAERTRTDPGKAKKVNANVFWFFLYFLNVLLSYVTELFFNNLKVWKKKMP